LKEHLARSAAQVSEPAFKAVWDNPDDAEYDRLVLGRISPRDQQSLRDTIETLFG
jgi:hypothetical protein